MSNHSNNKDSGDSSHIIKALEWRYATKKFDHKKLSSEQEKTLLHAISLTPTSYGLEPYEIVVVKDKVLREKLKEVSWGQSQVTDASHFFVFAARNSMTEKDIDDFLKRIVATRGVTLQSLDSYKQMMMAVAKLSPEHASTWAKKQAYIALGNAMTAAATLGLDACPMEGLDPAAYDKILGLQEKGYTTAVALAVGFRAADDKYAALKKVRKGEKLFVTM